MKSQLAITATGLITGVGLNAPTTCAAIRCAIDNFQETRFMDSAGEWILGCQVPMEESWQGKTELIKMAATAINEVTRYRPDVVPAETPLLLRLAEQERSGRVVKDDTQLYLDLQEKLGLGRRDRVLLCEGPGFAVETAHVDSDEPHRAAGLPYGDAVGKRCYHMLKEHAMFDVTQAFG